MSLGGSHFGNRRQRFRSRPFQARSEGVDLRKAVVRLEVSEVLFQALLLPLLGESFKDSQSHQLLGVWNVEFPKLVRRSLVVICSSSWVQVLADSSVNESLCFVQRWATSRWRRRRPISSRCLISRPSKGSTLFRPPKRARITSGGLLRES